MTLLELIASASTNSEAPSEPSKYPLTFNPDPIIPILRPDSESPGHFTLVEPLKGFENAGSESALAESNAKFFKKLKRKLKNPKFLSSSGFTDMLILFLRQIGAQVEASVVKDSTNEVYACRLVEKLGPLIGKDVVGLMVEACVLVENWELLETVIVNGLVVDLRIRSGLISNLANVRCYDLICSCIKGFPDLNSSDLCNILRLFLNPSKEDRSNLARVRKEWEDQALLAVEKAGGHLTEETTTVAKEASILLMVAYDGFSASELCLHYLISSSNVDEVVFSNAISKLSIEEILGLIGYLGKWLRKYEMFPQAVPCPEAPIVLRLRTCEWVPSVEDVVGCLGLVLDEHFPTLVLHSEFHEELKSIEEVVGSLVVEGRMCCSVASLFEVLNESM